MTEPQDKNTENQNNQGLSREIEYKVRGAANYCYNCNKCVSVCPLNHVGLFAQWMQ